MAEASWNVMAHAQKPDFVFRRNGWVNLKQQGRHFSRLLAAEVFTSAVVMLDTPSSEVVWRVLTTHSIRQFPLHFPSCASPGTITFQLESTFLHVTVTKLDFIYVRTRTQNLLSQTSTPLQMLQWILPLLYWKHIKWCILNATWPTDNITYTHNDSVHISLSLSLP